MEDYEKLGVFYLGRRFDLKNRRPTDELLLYDSKDLVTHAVCVGMTGSGKTGLCIGLLEEAALDAIPAIIIDPKGDLTNLLLTFPELRPEDFLPWVNASEATRKGLTPEQYATEQASLWREGLAEWGQSGDRIKRLREAAEFAVYTPGSTAGTPVSILKSFAAPAAAARDDEELLRDRIASTVASLLGLLGIEADPLQSREHILISTILEEAWRNGRDLDLAALIGQIQEPPVSRIGVMDVATFYPPKERFELAMRLNNLLAAPGFDVWMKGEALDPARLLHTPDGRPRVSILSIAHLSDDERMFFVSLLLNEVLAWVRTQPGTSSLRALLYMDEIFGFFPPVANPPSKTPLLTLLKQARAYGLGVVLATQNPVDLDYKGLSNTGTWFIGRLQTDRDKTRVLEGLEGVAAGSATAFDRGSMEETLAGLGQRVFLLYNVHEDAPEIFQTRWVMSYLSGPMTRPQIKALSAGAGEPAERDSTEVSPSPAAPVPATPPLASDKPLLPPEIPQVYAPAKVPPPQNARLFYAPVVMGFASVRYPHEGGTYEAPEVGVTAPIDATASALLWEEATAPAVERGALSRDPDDGASFGEVPAPATDPKNYDRWARDFADWVRRSQTLELLESPSLKLTSEPGESEGEFRARLDLAAREERDAWQEKLREKYGAKQAKLEDRLRRAEQAVERESEQAQSAKRQTAVSLGTTLLGAFLGRKKLSTTTMNRAATAARGVGRSLDQNGDVERAQENLEALLQEQQALEAEFRAELESAEAGFEAASGDLETTQLRPKKSDVQVHLLALAWLPWWVDAVGGRHPAWDLPRREVT